MFMGTSPIKEVEFAWHFLHFWTQQHYDEVNHFLWSDLLLWTFAWHFWGFIQHFFHYKVDNDCMILSWMQKCFQGQSSSTQSKFQGKHQSIPFCNSIKQCKHWWLQICDFKEGAFYIFQWPTHSVLLSSE